MSDLKNVDGDNYPNRRAISVFACQSDTTHPTVLGLAEKAGFISKERLEELTNVQKGTKPLLDNQELSVILENYFGFSKGNFETHEIMAIQTTRFGKKVVGEYRYTGEERNDDEWCNSQLCSREAREKNRHGSIVTMDEGDGVMELHIDDMSRRDIDDY